MNKNVNDDNWKDVKDYLLNHEDCRGVHKLVHFEHAIITDRKGHLYRIEKTTTVNDLKRFIKNHKVGFDNNY